MACERKRSEPGGGGEGGGEGKRATLALWKIHFMQQHQLRLFGVFAGGSFVQVHEVRPSIYLEQADAGNLHHLDNHRAWPAKPFALHFIAFVWKCRNKYDFNGRKFRRKLSAFICANRCRSEY